MEFESANRSIIAMKGHPFTRKSQFAAHIAASLKCQLLSLHDFLDVLSPHYFQACPCKPAAASPNDVAFGIICQITKSHLSTGLFKHVVVDSRLCSRSHLDQLIQLAASLEQTRLVIIECKAEADNIYEWQTKFQDYLQLNHPQDKWYKPKNWEEVENEIRVGYDERSDGYEVSKLVVDPILDYQDSTGISPFIDAIQHMITRSEDDGPDLVVYRRWRQSRYLEFKESDRRRPYFRGMYGSMKIRFCSCGGGHYIEELGVVGLGHNTKCMSCKKQVTGAAYTCKHCSFALHKECAELLDDNNKPPVAPSHEDLSYKIKGWTEVLRGICLCSSCDEGYNPNSYPCDDCFFAQNLEQGVLPTVIRHGCDEHFLCVMFAFLNPNEEHFQCKACGDPVEVVWYSCKICGVAYHYSCLTEIPVRVEHEHGRHHHHMLLQYSSQEDEDYLCYVCFENGAPERRDPSRWFYSCEECEYVAHLRCVGDGMFSMNKCLNQEEELDVTKASQKSESWGSDTEEEDDDGELRPCSAGSGHDITKYVEEELEYEAKCGVCENQVTGAAYTCKLCSFALHKECAELVDDHNKPLVGLSAYSMDSVLSVGYQGFILDSSRCSSCAEKVPVDSDSSTTCGDCLFATHLKHKMLPTVIRHDCHQHFLSIVINDLNPAESKCGCNACGNPVDEIWYSCKMCGVDYDYECLTKVAVRVEHEHHRQHHHMLIQYSGNEAAGDSLCDVCLERGEPGTRDPSIWFYSCQDCTFEAHLKCVPRNGLTQDEDASSDDTNYGD